MEGIIENPLDPSSRKQQITSSTRNGTIYLCRRPRHTTYHPSPPLPSLILYALYCFPEFASTDFASALLLSGFLVHGLRVRFTAFRISRPRTSRSLYCFPDLASTDFASALLLSGPRVHGLRVRFTAFRTSRPFYRFPNFASTLLLFGLRVHGLRVHFTAFRTSRPLYYFPWASVLHLPLHIPQIPIMLLSHDRRGELLRRTTIEAIAGTKKGGERTVTEPRAIGEEHGPLRKAEENHQKNERTRNPENDGAGTVELFITESPNHRSTERCPIWDSKNPSQCQSNQRHVRTYFRGIPHKPGHPDLSQTPFLTGLARPAPLTSKQPPETGLQAPRDQRDHGTSFRRPFGTLQGSPRDVSAVANSSR
ncbi:hypothetical protein CRG98_035031 [Punica granatum]|uniref:Uncharacterized protein n=1 Tax=Punica granatum TaxID=22663 RepID=A0A2I0ILM8_PUNGR|nr:hypothetical protein CRG98_035031 [Punica granatum]